MAKYKYFSYLLFALFISSCASENSRYKDNTSLERPPEAPIDKQAQVSERPTDEAETEAPPRHHGKGLKSDVYVVEGSVRELKIKRTFDEAWSLLNQAVQLNELKIRDRDRSKGAYYVGYGGGNMFGLSALFRSDSSDQPTYLLKVKPQDKETKVTVSLASVHEQSDPSKLKDGIADDSAEDRSEQLLELLYDTLHNKVKDE